MSASTKILKKKKNGLAFENPRRQRGKAPAYFDIQHLSNPGIVEGQDSFKD